MRTVEIDFEGPVCEWTYDDNHWAWDTSCEMKHQFMEGGPNENSHIFCPYCGQPIDAQEPYSKSRQK